MKTPQFYVEQFAESLDWEKLITMIQKDAWNEAVDACAESAVILRHENAKWLPTFIVDRQSILKNKI